MSEIIKKLKNPLFYLPNFLYIRTKTGELKKFHLKEAQKIAIRKLIEQRKQGKPIRAIFLKARQLGISTLSEGLIFHDTATNSFKNSLIIAHEDSATQNLFNMSKLFYDEVPSWLKPMKKYSNEKALSFENPTTDDEEKRANPGLRSKITVATAKNVKTARSQTIHNLHASEVAFWDDAETLMLGLMQCIPREPNTMVLIESTANGIGGWFYDLWKGAERGENDFLPIFLAWFLDPDYQIEFESPEKKDEFLQEVMETTIDAKGSEVFTEERLLMEEHNLSLEQLNWRRYAIRTLCNGDIDQFKQEYPSTPDEAFIASGRPKFNVGALRKHKKKCYKGKKGYLFDKGGKIEFVEDEKGYVEIWKEPEPNKFYCIGADVAEGLAHGDYSDAYVGESEGFEIVANWHGHIDPDLYGKELVKLARYYNEAYVGVENNNHGLTTLRAINRLEYWNIYYQKTYDYLNDKTTQKMGWNTNRKTKPLMIDKEAEYIREGWIRCYDEDWVMQGLTYVIDDAGLTNAQPGCFDDKVMAMAILLQMLLEGKGEDFVPEIPSDDPKIYKKSKSKNNIFADIDKEKQVKVEYTV